MKEKGADRSIPNAHDYMVLPITAVKNLLNYIPVHSYIATISVVRLHKIKWLTELSLLEVCDLGEELSVTAMFLLELASSVSLAANNQGKKKSRWLVGSCSDVSHTEMWHGLLLSVPECFLCDADKHDT